MSAMRFSVPRHGTPGIEGASWIRAEGGDLPHPVLVRLGLGDDNRIVATGVLIEAEGELSTRALRLPLAGIVAAFVAAASRPATYKRLRRELFGIDAESEGEAAWRPDAPEGMPAWWLAADFLSSADRTQAVPRVRPGRRGYPDAHYRQVAQAYGRAKRKRPRAPIKALMAELHITEPTAHRWLRTARERGLVKGDGQ
jgi:hypothetical protein